MSTHFQCTTGMCEYFHLFISKVGQQCAIFKNTAKKSLFDIEFNNIEFTFFLTTMTGGHAVSLFSGGGNGYSKSVNRRFFFTRRRPFLLFLPQKEMEGREVSEAGFNAEKGGERGGSP